MSKFIRYEHFVLLREKSLIASLSPNIDWNNLLKPTNDLNVNSEYITFETHLISAWVESNGFF